MPEMRAAAYERYGGPEVLMVVRVPRPTPSAGEVVVRVLATSVNGGEIEARSGRLRLVTGSKFPQRMGVDLVGEIVEVAPDVTDLAPGDVIWAIRSSPVGTTAEYAAVPRTKLALAPTNISPAQAVTMLVGGTTALTGLRSIASLKAGERLLVRGAAGGVGSLAVQVGRTFGASVTAIARPQTRDFVTGLGATTVVDGIDDLHDLDAFDVIFDTVGSNLRVLRRRLAPGGRMVTITLDMRRRMASLAYLAISAVHGRERVRLFKGDPGSADLEELTSLAIAGQIRPVMDRVFDLEEVREAHRAFEAGGVLGKHVITISD